MLTAEDKEEIKRLVSEMIAKSGSIPAVASDPVVDVTARTMEVFGAREKALRWLKTPVRSLGDRAPISLLSTPEGVAQVLNTLGQIEHGIW